MNTKIILGIVGLALGLIVGILFANSKKIAAPEHTTFFTAPRSLTSFSLKDVSGNTFNAESLRGKLSVIFFGFTNCPDICPTTLNTLSQPSLQRADWQTIFVTVDPDRDDQATVQRYISSFNAGFKGIHGERSELEKLAKQMGVAYEKVFPPAPSVEDANDPHAGHDMSKHYMIDHTAALFFTNKEGHLVAISSTPHSVTSIGETMDYLSAVSR